MIELRQSKTGGIAVCLFFYIPVAWASLREVNAQFSQKENKLLTRNVRLGLDTHKHRRSLNVLVIGGSGAGKSRSYVKPSASVKAE